MRGPNRVGVEVAYGEIRHENTVGHPRGSQRTSIRPNLVAWAVEAVYPPAPAPPPRPSSYFLRNLSRSEAEGKHVLPPARNRKQLPGAVEKLPGAVEMRLPGAVEKLPEP